MGEDSEALRGCEGGASLARGIDFRKEPPLNRYFRAAKERDAIRISFILYLAEVAIGVLEVAASVFKNRPLIAPREFDDKRLRRRRRANLILSHCI